VSKYICEQFYDDFSGRKEIWRKRRESELYSENETRQGLGRYDAR